MLNVATPLTRLALPRTVEPSLNVTLPVGVLPAPVTLAATLAVKVTA